jgi:hypothetical protein
MASLKKNNQWSSPNPNPAVQVTGSKSAETANDDRIESITITSVEADQYSKRAQTDRTHFSDP